MIHVIKELLNEMNNLYKLEEGALNVDLGKSKFFQVEKTGKAKSLKDFKNLPEEIKNMTKKIKRYLERLANAHDGLTPSDQKSRMVNQRKMKEVWKTMFDLKNEGFNMKEPKDEFEDIEFDPSKALENIKKIEKLMKEYNHLRYLDFAYKVVAMYNFRSGYSDKRNNSMI